MSQVIYPRRMIQLADLDQITKRKADNSNPLYRFISKQQPHQEINIRGPKYIADKWRDNRKMARHQADHDCDAT